MRRTTARRMDPFPCWLFLLSRRPTSRGASSEVMLLLFVGLMNLVTGVIVQRALQMAEVDREAELSAPTSGGAAGTTCTAGRFR